MSKYSMLSMSFNLLSSKSSELRERVSL